MLPLSEFRIRGLSTPKRTIGIVCTRCSSTVCTIVTSVTLDTIVTKCEHHRCPEGDVHGRT